MASKAARNVYRGRAFERRVARIVGGRRYPADVGGRTDVESERFVVQAKYVRTLSLAQLTRLAVEMEREGRKAGKSGVVCVALPPPPGLAAVPLFVMTEHGFNKLTGGQ